MLLTLTVTGGPRSSGANSGVVPPGEVPAPRPAATDLGYLLVKNPAHTHTFDLSFGKAHVFYPEATEERCTAALLIDVDPVELVRGKSSGEPGTLSQYVNDRPYVASSFLSVAIAQALGSALGGKCKDRPDLVEATWPLEVHLSALPCRGGETLLRKLFEPLGYAVSAARLPLDERFPAWGQSPYYAVTLSAETTVRDALTHLYVLVPVLDDQKHYWVGDAEVANLLAKGEGTGGKERGWLAAHPMRDEIVLRYLKRQRPLFRQALARLVAEEAPAQEDAEDEADRAEEVVEARLSLNEERLSAVVDALRRLGARHVLDVGCGEGRLLKRLIEERVFGRIAGADVSARALEIAASRIRYEEMNEKQRRAVSLFQASVLYRDARFNGFDAITLVEVLEHVDWPRVPSLVHSVFGAAKPRAVVLTTPNKEHNVRFAGLAAGAMRHADHRFELTRAELAAWAAEVAERHGYSVEHLPIGPMDAEVGAPTQMAIFVRGAA